MPHGFQPSVCFRESALVAPLIRGRGSMPPGHTQGWWQIAPSFAWRVRCWCKSPRDGQRCQQGRDRRDGQTAEFTQRCFFNGFHGSIEPRNRFPEMGMAVQLLGVKQYFTSSFKFNFRRRRRWEEAFKKANMLSRDDRKMNLAATVLSSSAKKRPDLETHLSAMAHCAECVFEVEFVLPTGTQHQNVSFLWATNRSHQASRLFSLIQ